MIVIKKMETDAEFKGKAHVHYHAWQEAYRGLLDPGYLDALTLEKCETIAYRWPDNIIVAKDGDQVIGFAGYGTYRDGELENAGEIFAIYVLSDYYGKGVGQALLEEGIQRLPYPRIALWVLEGNRRAIRFYEKNGFQFDGRKEEIRLGTPATELRMVLERSK